jgi:serine protease Do
MKIKYLLISMIIIIPIIAGGCVYFNLDSSPTVLPTSTPSPINPGFTPPPTSSGQPLPTVPYFADIIAEVRPSVVAINVTIPGIDIFGGVIPQEGAGSGWIIDDSGLIVTNNHIVEGANSVTITLEDGRNFPASIIRTDPVSDLAVVKINADNLQAARIGDYNQLRVGDWVLAMGNSLGQGISATKGIISALGVSIPISAGQTLYNLIQTDAAINPGNSGGPLFNLLGEVVGITSVKVAQIGVEGTGYAISIEESLPIIADLVRVGYYSRPWIGVSLYTVDQVVVLRYRLSVNEGALITQVVSGSPADNVGLKAGDVITAVDGRGVASVSDLNEIIHGHQIGDQITITYYRGVAANTVTITLAPSPPL